MGETALLVVDVQTALLDGHPYRERETLKNWQDLLAVCRKKGVEVLFVRHDGGADDELERGAPGWEIAGVVAPTPGERVFDKRFNSAFRQTGLRAYLEEREISELILVGMQTEYCIDATCKAAFEYGYKLTIPEDAVTTFDNGDFSAEDLCAFYARRIWNNRFATVLPTKIWLEEMEKQTDGGER